MKIALISIAFLLFGSLPAFTSRNNIKTKGDTSAKYYQDGINFQTISFAEAKAMAAKTGKLVFIDAYTSWCGPCKLLEKNTFSKPEVGTFFNANFINMRVEMEQDKDAAEIYRTYTVQAYPSLLFIDAKGKLVRRIMGYRDASALLNEVKDLAIK
jgi:thiol:disulfide interchange protein